MKKTKKHTSKLHHHLYKPVHHGVSFVVIGVTVFLFLLLVKQGASPVQTEAKGFNEFGYNYDARIFNGSADGVDKNLDGKVWGDPTYANDKLKMKWNAEWDRGNTEGWSDSNGYDGAWTDNNWNGKVTDGSGETWQYRIKWIGDCGATGAPTGDGGYCIWNQFEVVLSQGTVANQHFWDAHAIPAGYGMK